MYLTMRAQMEEAEGCEDPAGGAGLAPMSHGALMGARGNSGVILSQIIGGPTRRSGGGSSVSAPRPAAGLALASSAGYKGASEPAAGRSLTRIREGGEGVGGGARRPYPA